MKNNLAIRFIEDLIKAEPAKASDIFEKMEFKEAVNLFKKLSLENQAKCVKHFDAKFAAKILSKTPIENTKEILSKIDRYKLVSIIRNSQESKFKNLLNSLDQNLKSSIYYLFDYPKNSAARIMYPDFISLKKDITVGEAVKRLRLLSKFGEIKSYVYVTDEDNNLTGVINARDLVISQDEMKIEEIMIKKVIKVSPYAHKNDLIKIFSARNFISLPVVDSSGKILGVVESKDVLESAREETMEDMQLLLGSNPDEKIDSSFSFKLKHRSHWLTINLVTVFLSASVVALFENTIAQISALAVLIPVVIGQGTVAGSQTLSVVIRALVMNEIDIKNSKKIIIQEVSLGLANGLICGLLTGFTVYLWKKEPLLSLAGFFAVVLNTLVAGVSGAAIPILMKKLNYDPAHSSVVILTTVTDIAGIFFLLSLGTLVASRI
ncbi:MAG: magnesium transporter [Elusimicrobia bacterium]|nr:magnesium transporter [Elusimicrobiota bacterium]